MVLLLTAIFLACNIPQEEKRKTREQQTELKAREFFDTFSDRTDWEKFCSFYSVDVAFDDIILQIHLDSLWKFKRFYKWDDEVNTFKKLSPDQKHLVLESLVVNDSIAVGRGHLNPFYYNEVLINTDWGMAFTIWLYFDENLKITKQLDWFEYDPAVLENVVKRCREKGFEATPDWLDLSRKEN